VSVFDQVQHEIIGLGGQSMQLSRSFRSHTQLVGMFNAFFEQILIREASPTQQFYVSYEAMVAHRDSEQHHDMPVTVLLLPSKSEEDDASKLSTDNLRQWEALELGQRLKRMVETETMVWDKDLAVYRPAQYGDIAILFQSLSKSPLYEQVFQNLGLPYITIAGKGYFDRQEVWDLMNLLRVLHNPSDNLALASVLRSPIFGVSDDGLLAMRLRQSDGDIVSLWEAMWQDEISEEWHEEWFSVPEDDGEAILFAREILASLHVLAGRVTIAELLNYALDVTAFEATLTGLSNGERRRANIQKLLDLAQKSGRVSLSEFNTYLQDMVASEAREGEAALETEGVITLMSVHKSKGLEFPIVVLADTSWSRNETYPALFVDPLVGPVCKLVQENGEDVKPFAYLLGQKYARERDLAERKRLLYVAATRAQDYLVMSGVMKSTSSTSSKTDWMMQIRGALSDGDYRLDDDLIPDVHPSRVRYDWGNLELIVPVMPKRKTWVEFVNPHQTLWDQVAPTASSVSNWQQVPPQLPLMRDVAVEKAALKRHVNATQLERLGRIPFEHPEHNGRADFRRMLLRDMPQPIKPIAHQHLVSGRVPGYIIGEVVHQALKVGLLPNTQTAIRFEDGIRAYAWEMGVTNELAVNFVVKEAQRLLTNFIDSDAYKLLETATQINREIEFVYEHHRYIIHGIIDVLFFANRQWHIMDYKTNRVDFYRVEGYSLRYRYQMGAYAKAVEQQTGQIPVVCLHYLHPNRLYTLPTYEWQEAMEDLDTEIEVTLYEGDFESGVFDE
jgi:ATP-dependent exoDNAse (exonuclease V) beta subunit